jgi:hypothetical protein
MWAVTLPALRVVVIATWLIPRWEINTSAGDQFLTSPNARPFASTKRKPTFRAIRLKRID